MSERNYVRESYNPVQSDLTSTPLLPFFICWCSLQFTRNVITAPNRLQPKSAIFETRRIPLIIIFLSVFSLTTQISQRPRHRFPRNLVSTSDHTIWYWHNLVCRRFIALEIGKIVWALNCLTPLSIVYHKKNLTQIYRMQGAPLCLRNKQIDLSRNRCNTLMHVK